MLLSRCPAHTALIFSFSRRADICSARRGAAVPSVSGDGETGTQSAAACAPCINTPACSPHHPLGAH
jgi:hypothetical protein